MFQIFGNEIYDSNDIIKSLEKDFSINTISDLTKSTSREDTISLKCEVDINLLSLSEKDLNNEDLFNQSLEKCESYINLAISELNLKYSNFKCCAYKYDEYKHTIKAIICIMYVETARKKLNEMMKRLIKNND